MPRFINGLKYRVKSAMIRNGLFDRSHLRGGKCVVMYHGIDLHENTTYNPRFFGRSTFEKHIRHFKNNHHVVSLEALMEGKGLRTDRLNVAITFDDGYRNNFTYALPVLEAYQANATFFITGLNQVNGEILWADLLDLCGSRMRDPQIEFNGKVYPIGANGKFDELRHDIRHGHFMGSSKYDDLKRTLIEASGIDLNHPSLLDHWQLLTDDGIRLIARSKYVTIGSHGMYHNNLGNIAHADAVEELRLSKKYLENLTQYEIRSVGYPDGSYSRELVKAAAELGMKYQCAVNYHYDDDASDTHLTDRLGLYPPANPHVATYQISEFLS